MVGSRLIFFFAVLWASVLFCWIMYGPLEVDAFLSFFYGVYTVDIYIYYRQNIPYKHTYVMYV